MPSTTETGLSICGAYYGTGDPASPTAVCGRLDGHPSYAEDHVGHSPTPTEKERQALDKAAQVGEPSGGVDEQVLADALVSVVCRCGPVRHQRGFPDCDTARRAARVALEVTGR